ncbi:MAG: amino acid transporter [Simkaniaceae bacterium]|nr:amino acid transporter [Simkaniaceae bacterium]
MAKREHLIGAIFLIAGTCVGAGMLGLPIETGQAGFLPSFVVITLAYLFMMLTGLLLVEANLWMEEGVHYSTMAHRLLGRPAKHLTTLLYLFMGYGSLIAYTAGGSMFLNPFVAERWHACLIFGVVFGIFLGFGTKFLGRINSILVAGMIAAYVLIVALGVGGVNYELLTHRDWRPTFLAVPLLLATFSYQMILPSLTSYLKRDPHSLRAAVIWGTSIPYVAYMIWELIVLGIVPLDGPMSLSVALEQGIVATQPLRYWGKIPSLSVISEFFGFFAIITSFFGIGMATYDFLADLTGIEKRGAGKLALLVMVILPTLFFAILYPKAFYVALDLSGGFGDAILSCLLPISMVWVGRYHKRLVGPYRVFGERALLVILALLSVFVVYIQVLKLL